jgi:t-SNARE complex subunit (syntaxin)
MENLTNSVNEEPKFELDSAAVSHLAETRKWTMFMSVLGFIFLGLMLIVLIVLVFLGSSFSNSGFSTLVIIPILLMCGIYFFPIYYLFRFSSFSGQALIKKDNGLLSQALRYLKLHYRFMGILLIIVICIYVVVIVGVIVAGGFPHSFNTLS